MQEFDSMSFSVFASQESTFPPPFITSSFESRTTVVSPSLYMIGAESRRATSDSFETQLRSMLSSGKAARSSLLAGFRLECQYAETGRVIDYLRQQLGIKLFPFW
jgi:hypothetical protein